MDEIPRLAEAMEHSSKKLLIESDVECTDVAISSNWDGSVSGTVDSESALRYAGTLLSWFEPHHWRPSLTES
ncbi:hypothetical protein PoB_001589800 [Plakobranchus ocellatus]|uniref:Uncharacterized protein n=1 Tax=Plakobranchus ocellatus TaxID=259542 RepID=A0AAV3Z4L3_9GAST|nr:hypothetical protein PoB_001589800 [Plakobranchus ocellatus]